MLKLTEKGFTLVEVLVAIAILSAIGTVMSAAVIMIIQTNAQNTEWNVNLRQVQTAGHWISKDALMAQEVDTNKTGVLLSLGWSDWSGNSFNIDYVLEGNTLKRKLNDNSEFVIAEYIVPESTTCVWTEEENKLTATIRASMHGDEGERWVERTYEISPRPVAKGD